MNYSNWKSWYKKLPLYFKWFVLIVLFRPIIDQFYFLKEISPLLSPLYIVGFFTPVLIIMSFFSRRFPRKLSSIKIDLNFAIWSILVVFNLLFTFLFDNFMDAIANFIKYSTPLILFYYLRHFIRSKENLIGILNTFIISATIPALLLGYEYVFGSLNAEYLNESRGGGERMQGGYADIMNYAIYISGALIIKLYFYLRSRPLAVLRRKQFKGLLIICVISVFGLIAIKQTASWIVFIYLALLMVIFSLKSRKGVLIITIMTPFIIWAGVNLFQKNIEPLVEREYAVVEGEKDIGRAFNGRASRWIFYFDIYFDMPIYSNLLGTPLSLKEDSKYMISGLMHNEFVRIFFLSGLIGLLLYLLFLIQLVLKLRVMRLAERFLGLAAIGSFILFSFSTTPLIYAPYLYFILPILAYLSIPPKVLSKQNA